MKKIVQGICVGSSMVLTASAFNASTGSQIFAYVLGAVAFIVCAALAEDVM